MSLPLILAGPILRRVEPNLVAVWIALSRAALITLTLYEGRTKTGAPDHLVRSDPATATLSFGDRLHVTTALLRIPRESEKALKPGVVYSYDVAIAVDGATHTLASLGLLAGVPTANGGASELARPHLALGYIDDFLPSFALPPATLDELRIVYGSCRRPVNEHPDAMAMIDDFIDDQKLYADALQRPHQLVLGGDQIYADDLWAGQLVMVNALANELIGTYEGDSSLPGPKPRVPIETVSIDYALRSTDATSDGEEPTDSEEPTEGEEPPPGSEEDPGSRWVKGGPTPLPVDLIAFPAGRRKGLVLHQAQMTTVDGESHLFSFGEFAALYVMVWSNACWPLPPDAWPKVLDVYPQINTTALIVPPDVPAAPDWNNLRPEDLGTTKEKERYKASEGLKDGELADCLQAQRQIKLELRHAENLRKLGVFYAALPKVRRVLANIPTYMIMDDHDATDDWNLNPIWVDRVNNTTLGRTILRNALAAYAVFQDWGNDPLRYLNERNDTGPSGDPQRMLQTIAAMFPVRTDGNAPPASAERPPKPIADALDHFLGLDLRPQPTIDGRYDAVNPPIKWHFSVAGPRHLLIAIDNRTRRSFVSREGPPGNIAIGSQDEQIPATLPPGCELLIIAAPLQVLGAGLLDELIAPTAYRVFDAKAYSKLNPSKDDQKEEEGDKEEKEKAEEEEEKKKKKDVELRERGTRRMVGTDPDAIEAWAFDPLTLEALLARLSRHRRVLLLSGDVHYSAANELSYWTKGEAVPARIVQFTSSGFKNVMPWYIGAVDRVLSFAQRMIRANIGAERMGWNTADEKAFVFAAGTGLADIPPVLRRKLNQSPMLMPTFGWPQGTTVAPDRLPDWSWRSKPTLDVRPEAERPPPGRPRALEPDEARIQALLAEHVDPGRELAAYATIAARHQDQFEKLRHARQILFRANFALVRFERTPVLTAVHEVYTALPDPGEAADAAPKPFAYMVQKAALDGDPAEVRPELAPFHPPAF